MAGSFPYNSVGQALYFENAIHYNPNGHTRPAVMHPQMRDQVLSLAPMILLPTTSNASLDIHSLPSSQQHPPQPQQRQQQHRDPLFLSAAPGSFVLPLASLDYGMVQMVPSHQTFSAGNHPQPQPLMASGPTLLNSSQYHSMVNPSGLAISQQPHPRSQQQHHITYIVPAPHAQPQLSSPMEQRFANGMQHGGFATNSAARPLISSDSRAETSFTSPPAQQMQCNPSIFLQHIPPRPQVAYISAHPPPQRTSQQATLIAPESRVSDLGTVKDAHGNTTGPSLRRPLPPTLPPQSPLLWASSTSSNMDQSPTTRKTSSVSMTMGAEKCSVPSMSSILSDDAGRNEKREGVNSATACAPRGVRPLVGPALGTSLSEADNTTFVANLPPMMRPPPRPCRIPGS